MCNRKTFTTCFKKKPNFIKRINREFFKGILKYKFIKTLDDKYTPLIAEKLFKKGSVIRVLARKTKNI